ncbi:helix-turn-helix domain-containing protein [Paenibacillus sp. HJGM_3]|uniref:helix-turn-helix domain-containing protein n=1 Tax=Paenibacillus sp. HJGM_3 TaxID=3379816 RepID=UPI00385D8E8F
MTADKSLAVMIEALKQQIKQEVIEELQAKCEPVEDRRLTIEEAAEYLRISRETLYRLCKEKQIEHITIGSIGSKKPRINFSLSVLEAWIRKKELESVSLITGAR